MNERIKQLAEQAQKVAYYTDGGYTPIMTLDQEKFAELIVKECAQVCLSQRDPANLNYKPSVKFAEAVKHHFGVKE
jgi:hypothetical protein